MEQIYVKVNVGGLVYIIGSIYVPPCQTNDKYEQLCDEVELLLLQYPDKKIILCGDFNLPDWQEAEKNPSLYSQHSSPINFIMDSFLNILDLQQANNICNHMGRKLDLVFTNYKGLEVKRSSSCLVDEDKLHPTLDIISEVIDCSPSELKFNDVVYNFAKGDYISMNNFLSHHRWTELFKTSEVNESVSHLYSVLSRAIEQFVPITKFNNLNLYPRWFSSELIEKVKAKKKCHSLYKQTGGSDHYREFSKLRAECKYLSNQCYDNYILNVENSIHENIRNFWNYVNSINKSSVMPSIISYRGESSSDGHVIADMFANHFSTVYEDNPVGSFSPGFGGESSIILHDYVISYSEVENTVNGLDERKSSGPDNIPPVLIKNCISYLITPLIYIFNLSLKTGVFPDLWKSAYVIPIFKSGDKSNVSNYRPIYNLFSLFFQKYLTLLSPKG